MRAFDSRLPIRAQRRRNGRNRQAAVVFDNQFQGPSQQAALFIDLVAGHARGPGNFSAVQARQPGQRRHQAEAN
jgi:hypothetical protein